MTDSSDPAKSKCIVKHLQLPTRNPVTLKFLNELLDKRAKILQRLGDHPALPKHLACIQEGADFYWVRSFIPGKPLQADMAVNQPRSEPAVRQLITEVLSCLEVLQHHGVVHQNLHPNNLIRHQNDEHLVLVDYSLAQEGYQSRTDSHENGNGVGNDPFGRTPLPYLPQVAYQHYPRFNADHFALGMIALQAATGLKEEALPRFQQPDFCEQFKLQMNECSTLSSETKHVLLGLVSHQPANEFATAKAILAQLAFTPVKIAKKQPTVAHETKNNKVDRQPTGAKAMPATKRSSAFNRWWIALAAVPLLLLAGGIGFRVPQRIEVARLSRQAEEAERTGQVEEAIGYLDKILARQPDRANALAKRSFLFWDNGDSDRALENITAAIQAQPNPQWYFKRGNMRLHVGDHQGAIEDYTEAIRLKEDFSDAYVNRGNARAERGEEEGAVQDYTAALAFAEDPQVRAFAYLNRCLSLSNLQDDAEAIADCTEAINIQPNNSLAYENRGLVKRRLGDLQGALQDFTIAIQIDPSSPEPYYNRALTRQQLGDVDGAMEDFNQTVALNPDHPFAYYDRGLLHTELGQTTQAIADFERVATVCLEVGRVGCFEDAQYQLSELGVETP